MDGVAYPPQIRRTRAVTLPPTPRRWYDGIPTVSDAILWRYREPRGHVGSIFHTNHMPHANASYGTIMDPHRVHSGMMLL